MRYALNIYTDDSFTDIKRVAEADRCKIPYRVSMNLITSLEGIDLKDADDIIRFLATMPDMLDKIVKATFHVSELELECIDVMEFGPILKDMYDWAMTHVKGLEAKVKNVQTAVTTASA